jgi:hypothetical protein
VKAGDSSGVANTTRFTPGLTSGTGFVFFSCATNAPKASCSVSTSDPVSPFVVNSSPSGAPETVTVSVATTANAILPPFFFNPRMRFWVPILIAELVVLAVAFFLALRMRGRVKRQLCGIAAVLILVGLAIAGCGGSSAPPPPPPPPSGTPPGSYTVTVYAFTESNVSDGSNANADANVAIPLTVN